MNLFGYFTKGFSLLIKNLDIYLISLVFSIILIINPLFIGKIPSSTNFLNVILGLVVALLSLSYSFSVPLFFNSLQQGNKLNSSYILHSTLRNAKRLMIPLVVLILGLIGLVMTSILIIILLGLNPDNIKIFTQDLSLPQSSGYTTLMVLLGVIFSLLNFTSIFFSVENLGLFTSMKKSILFSFRNLKFTLMILIITLFSNLLTFLMDPLILNQKNVLFSLIQSSVLGFVFLGTQISSLLYYQDHKSLVSR